MFTGAENMPPIRGRCCAAPDRWHRYDWRESDFSGPPCRARALSRVGNLLVRAELRDPRPR